MVIVASFCGEIEFSTVHTSSAQFEDVAALSLVDRLLQAGFERDMNHVSWRRSGRKRGVKASLRQSRRPIAAAEFWLIAWSTVAIVGTIGAPGKREAPNAQK
jgi:hypothetical protein